MRYVLIATFLAGLLLLLTAPDAAHDAPRQRIVITWKEKFSPLP